MNDWKKIQFIRSAFPSSAFTVTPDADMYAKYGKRNTRRRVFSVIGGILFVFGVFVAPFSPIVLQQIEDAKNKKENTLFKDPSAYVSAVIMLASMAGVGTILGLCFASGMEKSFMDEKTRESRAKKILELLEIQKTRPLTLDEYNKIQQLLTFKIHGETVEPKEVYATPLTQGCSYLDSGYYRSLAAGNLNKAKREIKHAIKEGHLGHGVTFSARQKTH